MRDIAGNTPFWDQSGLSALKKASNASDPESQRQAAREAAAQFEGLLLSQMLKSAKPVGSDNPGLFNSAALSSFKDMFENQVAMNVGRRGLGLAQVIERQLQGTINTEGKR